MVVDHTAHRRRSRSLFVAGRLVLMAAVLVLPAACTEGERRARPEQAALDEQLRRAAWANDLAGASRLVGQGADVNAKDGTVQSAYLISTSEGHWELLDLFLDRGASLNDKDSWNGTGLIRAAERGHALVVGRLLRAGIDSDHVNRIGYQAIHEAVWFGKDDDRYLDTVRALVAGRVELTRPSDREGLTPLQMATTRGLPGLARTLAAATAPAELKDPTAALLGASADGDADLAALALRAGAEIEGRDDRGRTSLALAATHDRVDVARLLVAMGGDPDAVDDQGDTPWLITGVTGSVAMLEVLLPAGPDLKAVNRFGGTALIPASDRGHVAYVRRAVSTGIDIDHVNALGWTALLEAVVLGDGGPSHQEIVRILVDAGADRSIKDKSGRTALDHAKDMGFAEIETILSRP